MDPAKTIDYLISSTNKHRSIQAPLKSILTIVLDTLITNKNKKYNIVSISKIVNLLSTIVHVSNLYLYKSGNTNEYEFRCNIFNQLLLFHSNNISECVKSMISKDNDIIAKTLINCLKLVARNINTIININSFKKVESDAACKEKELKEEDRKISEEIDSEEGLDVNNTKKILDYFDNQWNSDKEIINEFIDEYF